MAENKKRIKIKEIEIKKIIKKKIIKKTSPKLDIPKNKKVIIKPKNTLKTINIKDKALRLQKIIKKVKNKVIEKITKKTTKTKTTKSSKSLKKNKVNIPKKENKLKKINLELERSPENPILSPSENLWESVAVFNPGVVYLAGKVHLFYRAMGPDGISRIGYAYSPDGVNFTRLSYPVFSLQEFENLKKDNFTSPARLVFDPVSYASGGGWGGCEDPRVVCIDGMVYITLNIFNGWQSLRVGVLSIKEEDLLNQNWNWNNFSYLSHLNDRQKNWVLFPEKINDKFAIFHNLDMNDGDINKVGIALTNELSTKDMPSHFDAPDPQRLPDRNILWHKRTRSISCPPMKTKDGWLVLYHAMDKYDGDKYKLGAMLLDLKNPKKILCRAKNPILESREWYENDYKPGIIYASGGLIINEDLFVYYGGGDKRVNVATIKLNLLLESMKENQDVKLEKLKTKKFL